jgi:competence protein ComEA
MEFLKYRFTAIILLLVLTGCTTQQSPQDVKEKTAQATAELKTNAKAVAEGIREGWNRDKPLDLNSATKNQLTNLPGVSAITADKIIAGRPYDRADELVTRHIMPKSLFDKIADQVTAKK